MQDVEFILLSQQGWIRMHVEYCDHFRVLPVQYDWIWKFRVVRIIGLENTARKEKFLGEQSVCIVCGGQDNEETGEWSTGVGFLEER